ncbi:MAG: GTPase, partial [Chloroflexota bacterium]|nr:GTPase [Chloroflexota bacterium]
MTEPVIAIVGRTNVGKSTLLNRLVGGRLAVVGAMPEVTRDRVFASTSRWGRELTLFDTAGWQAEPQTELEGKIKQQVEVAVAQADVVIFMVDARDGAVAADEEIAAVLHTAGKPTVLAVNKVDSG